LEDIAREFEDISSESVVVDLGCGDGRVITRLADNNPNAQYIGIERALFPYLLARLRVVMEGKRDRVSILKQDIYTTDLSEATHVFCYLFTEAMDELLPKIEREAKAPVKVVSLDFEFRKKVPERVVTLKHSRFSLGSRLLVYQIWPIDKAGLL
jgi:16S rRNA A1518/A1519 N6-dimethyltransferase RsmA/KsgA/DIM1 with predicted DNA glycosylase/AP lyase activity